MTPTLDLTLFGVRWSSLACTKKLATRKLASLPIDLQGVISSGGKLRETWHWNDISSGQVELDITYYESEAVKRLKDSRSQQL